MENEAGVRLEAAKAARAVLARELSFDAFIARFGSSTDGLIAEVVDLITHEPKRGGASGARAADWNQYRRDTISAIEALEHK